MELGLSIQWGDRQANTPRRGSQSGQASPRLQRYAPLAELWDQLAFAPVPADPQQAAELNRRYDGIPKEILVNYTEIAHALDKSISKIETAVLNALEMTPPELSADIYRTGIYLAGGGALLRGLDKRIHMKTKLPVHLAEDPLHAVARGTGIALKNFDKFNFLIK